MPPYCAVLKGKNEEGNSPHCTVLKRKDKEGNPPCCAMLKGNDKKELTPPPCVILKGNDEGKPSHCIVVKVMYWRGLSSSCQKRWA